MRLLESTGPSVHMAAALHHRELIRRGLPRAQSFFLTCSTPSSHRALSGRACAGVGIVGETVSPEIGDRDLKFICASGESGTEARRVGRASDGRLRPVVET